MKKTNRKITINITLHKTKQQSTPHHNPEINLSAPGMVSSSCPTSSTSRIIFNDTDIFGDSSPYVSHILVEIQLSNLANINKTLVNEWTAALIK